MEKGNSVDPDLIVPVDQVAGEVATRPSEDKENGDGARMLSSEAETIAAFRARQQRGGFQTPPWNPLFLFLSLDILLVHSINTFNQTAQAFLGSLALSTDAAHTNTQPKRKEKTDRDAFATATNVRVSAVSRTQVESRPVSAGSKNKTQPVSNSSFSLNALKAAVTNSAASDLENQYQPPSAWKNMSDAMGASVNKLLNSASIPDVSNSFLPFFTRPSSIFQPAAPNSNNAPPRKSSLDPAEDIELEIVVLGNHEEPNPNSNRREEVRGTKRPKKELLGKEDYQMKRLTAPPIFGDTSSSVGPSTPRIETLDDEAVTPVERNLSESDDVIPIRVNRAGSLGGSSAPFGLFNMSGGSTSKSHQAMVKVSDRKSSLGGGSPWRMFDPADPNNKFMVGRAPTGSGANSVMEKRITVGRLRTMSSRELDEQTGSPVRRKTGGSRNSLAHHYTYSHNPAYPPSSATAQQQIVHSIQHMTSSVGELITSVFRNPTSGALQHVSYASPHHMSPFEAEMRNLPNLRESTTSTRNMTNNSANNSNSNVSFRGPERKGSMGDATSVVLHVAPGRRSDGSGGSRGEDLDAERQSLIQTIPARHLNNIRTKNSVDLNNLNQLLNAKIIFVPPSGGYPISTFTVIGTVENQPKEKKRKAKSLFGSQPL
ncbi:hypothetical protein BCR33DRAFT_92735 [Rhizoclosmatium globosum]|uniref:Uncharacterized protein n=1 Tax=Rhizoclosmatium globosum TaxID=329046 RepID=A0A1Y2CLL6_9FUNG|nr:hypothetical protein BCR33DRAFT_92735 [Rhizoclosmatium globosum]|eukprot:ORY47235.1 hypothetical protein BCR33DRAFT_92735 [Rhizoclosmatium globosum]